MYKNLKIATTDETHLRSVCDVLVSMGYVEPNKDGDTIYASDMGNTVNNYGDILELDCIYTEVTLTDLLRMRDEMVKENANRR